MDGRGVNHEQERGRVFRVFRFIEQLRCFDAVGGCRATDAEQVDGKVHTDGGERRVVVRFEKFSQERFEKFSDFFVDSAFFPNGNEPKPKRVGRKQGKTQGCGFLRAV